MAPMGTTRTPGTLGSGMGSREAVTRRSVGWPRSAKAFASRAAILAVLPPSKGPQYTANLEGAVMRPAPPQRPRQP